LTQAETATLSITCVKCNGAVALAYELNGDRGRYRLQKWTCPHCLGPNTINMSGRILTIDRAPNG
jgi:hypothetical protein